MCKAYGVLYRCRFCSELSNTYYVPESAMACDLAEQAGPNAKLGDCGSIESVAREHSTPATCINCRSQGLAEFTSIYANPTLDPAILTSEDARAFRRVITIAEASCKVPAKGAKGVDRAAQQATIASAKAALDRIVDSQRVDDYREAYYAADAIPSHRATQSAACEAVAILNRATESRTSRTSSSPVAQTPVKPAQSTAARKAPAPADDPMFWFRKAHDDIAASWAELSAPSTKASQSAAPPAAEVTARATRSRTPRTSSPSVVEAKVKATRSPAARKTPATAVQTSTKTTKSVATRSGAAPAVVAPASAPRGRKRKSSEEISEAKRPAPGLRRSARNAGK